MTKKRSTPDHTHLCQFQFADGRKCRMLRHKDHAAFCIFHCRAERQLLLHSVPLVKHEIINAKDSDFWRHLVHKTLVAFSPPRTASGSAPNANPPRLS